MTRLYVPRCFDSCKLLTGFERGHWNRQYGPVLPHHNLVVVEAVDDAGDEVDDSQCMRGHQLVFVHLIDGDVAETRKELLVVRVAGEESYEEADSVGAILPLEEVPGVRDCHLILVG